MQKKNLLTVERKIKAYLALVAMVASLAACNADGPADHEFFILMKDLNQPHVNEVMADYLGAEGFKIVRKRRTMEFDIVEDMFLATKPWGFQVLSLSMPLSGREDEERCGDFSGRGHADPGQFAISIWNDLPYTDEPVTQLNNDLRQMLADRGFEVLDEPAECSVLVKAYAPS